MCSWFCRWNTRAGGIARRALGFSDWRRSEGELLFPARWGRPEVENLKRDMDKFAWAGQYQQRPAPRGGGIFPYTGWELWSRSIAVTYGRNESQYPDFDMIVGSLDPAFGEKQENDFCGVYGDGGLDEPSRGSAGDFDGLLAEAVAAQRSGRGDHQELPEAEGRPIADRAEGFGDLGGAGGDAG